MTEITLQEIKDYLFVDSNDEDNLINSLIIVARNYIDGMVGEAYKSDTKAYNLSLLLIKKLIYDMYNNRATEIPNNTKQDRIVSSILDKLSLYEIEV